MKLNTRSNKFLNPGKRCFKDYYRIMPIKTINITHEAFAEKYAAMLEREDIMEVQNQRGSGALDDNSYLEKLMAFGISREDAVGYMESDRQMSAMFEDSRVFNDMEAVTLLMMNDLDNQADLRQQAVNNVDLLREKLISTNGMNVEEAGKVVAYLLKPE